MYSAQDGSHGRYLSPNNPRRHSEAVSEISSQSSSYMRSQSRMMKRQRRMQAEIPRHYQTAPSTSNYGAPAYNRSMSSGSGKRPLSFIATFASKVKNAIEGWQDSAANRNSGRFNFNVGELDSNSDSSPSLQKRQVHPRQRKSNERITNATDRTYPSGKTPARKTYSSGSFNSTMNPSFAEVMEILSVPSSPELERPSNLLGSYADDTWTYQSDVSSEQNCDKIKACDLTKSDGDINILVIGAEGVGKSALIVRYLTKRFIGEYASNAESIYDHVVSIDDRNILIHIWDSGIPQMLQKSSEAELDMFDISEILSMTSLNSPSRTSTSSTSSAYDNRKSSSSFEEEVAMTLQLPSSSLRLDDRIEKKPGVKKRKKGKKEVNNNLKTTNEMDMRIFWADCVVIVYSICDAGSYDSARDIVRYIRGQTVRGHPGHKSPISPTSNPTNADAQEAHIPILIVGNKADLRHRRRVKRETALSFSEENDCSAIELSVSEQYEPIHTVFNDVIETIYQDKCPSKSKNNRPEVRTASGGFTHKRNLSL